MSLQETAEIGCPYCGERNSLLIDCSVPVQEYIEDCQVCCRPMNLKVVVDADGVPCVEAGRDDD